MTQEHEHDLKPTCVHCSRAWREQNSNVTMAIVPVAEATIIRPTPNRYIAVVRCHEQSAIVELGDTMPSDAKVRSARAFAA